MSTSLLYHAFGIRGYRQTSINFVEGSVLFRLEQPRKKYRCPECGSAAVHAQGHKERFLQTVPIGLKPTYLLVKVPRVICFQCERTRQVKVPFADPRRTYTHAFERYALELSKFTTIQDAARHLDVSWDIIKDIQKRNLQRRFGKPKLKNLKEIAIDEVAVGKGHRYFTLVLDLRAGAIVYVGDGKGVAALTLFWRRLRAPAPRSGPWPPTWPGPTFGRSANTCPEPSMSSTTSMSSSCSTTSSAPCAANCIAN